MYYVFATVIGAVAFGVWTYYLLTVMRKHYTSPERVPVEAYFYMCPKSGCNFYYESPSKGLTQSEAVRHTMDIHGR